MSSAEPTTSTKGIEGVIIDIDDHAGIATFVVAAGVVTATVPPKLLGMVKSLRGRAVRLIVEGGSLREIRPAEKSSDWYFAPVEDLAAQQGTLPVGSIAELKADFWPDWQSVDDFIAAAKGRPER